jgi:DNA polymerase III subunit epsilon
MQMDFVAIDVETANADMSSICQIGLVYFKERELCEEWKSYIDPKDFFDGINISIHGIDESTVQGAPQLPEIADTLYRFLDKKITVCHTHFDRISIRKAFEKYGIRHPENIWLDSARVARRTWKEFERKGYGLHNICEKLEYKFKHHDALEDAKAAGYIMLTAMEQSCLDLKGWLKRVNQPISGLIKTKRDVNTEGPLYGEVIVFTGALELRRAEAADMAAKIGFQVESGVTKKTTILVVGNQDIKKLVGQEKSSKHRKAEAFILSGQHIRIIGENDFKELINLPN